MGLTRPRLGQFQTTTTAFDDPIVVFNNNASGSNSKDIGIVFERGDDQNKVLLWDESADEFVLANSTEQGSTGGDVTLASYADLHINDLTLSGSIASLTINNAFTFPTADGTAGYVLQTDGAGTISWAAGSSSAGHTIQNAGSDLTTRTNLNFDGTYLVATDDSGNDQNDVTVSSNLQTWHGTTAPSGTVVGTTDTQTLTNKTLTTPVISSISNTGTLTLPTATDTLVGRATTDTLTNKTLTSPNITGLQLSGTTVTSTAAELNILDGVTATASEINTLDGITATTSELNIMDGVTATTSEINTLDGITATTTELNYVDGVTSAIQTQLNGKLSTTGGTITSNLTVTGNLTVNGTTTTVSSTNTVVSDNLIELNNGASSNANDSGIVIERGSTGDNAFMGWDESADQFIVGTTTATGSSTGNLTVTASKLTVATPTASSDAATKGYVDTQVSGTVSSLSDLGVTATASELNKMDGVTATTTEINYVDGVTSNIQTQLNAKASLSGANFTSDISIGTSDTTTNLGDDTEPKVVVDGSIYLIDTDAGTSRNRLWGMVEPKPIRPSRLRYSDAGNVGTNGDTTTFPNVYGEADLSGITGSTTFTYSAAWAALENVGARLPTLQELMAGVGAGSGQGYDSVYLWTQTFAGHNKVWVCKGQFGSYADAKIVDITDPLEVYSVRGFFDVSHKNMSVHYDDDENITANNFIARGEFQGTATSAQYADLAEKYMPDGVYQPGTVLQFGGEQEVTIANEYATHRVAGVVSTDPAYMMNSGLEDGVYIALQGRVPCRVVGTCEKGDLMVTSDTDGCAVAWTESFSPPYGSVIGKALENKQDDNESVIEVVVGVR